MTATSHSYGRPIELGPTGWIYRDTGESVSETGPRVCPHCHRFPEMRLVPICAADSHTGKDRFDLKPIDACLVNLVDTLNRSGCRTRSSCCGHGAGTGEILLQDGTVIVVPQFDTTPKGA